MNSNKKYFLFPKPHLNHLLFSFYFISSLLKQYIFKLMKKVDNLSIPVFKLYIYEIGDFLSVIPYLIIKKKTKSQNIKKSIDNNDNESNDLIYNDYKIEIFNKMKRPIIINIFFISLFNFIALISTIIFYLVEEDQSLGLPHANLNIAYIFNVFFLFLLTKFILNMEFYSHHYLSFIISILCFIIIIIVDFIEIKEMIKNKFINSVLYIVIRIFVVLLYSLENIFAKIMFFKYYYSPYLLLLMKAVIKFFFLIIFSIPLCFIKFKYKEGNDEKLIFEMFSDIFEDKTSILVYIIYLINSFFVNILIYLIIDKFSPTHTAIAYIFENLGIFIINSATEKIDIAYRFGIRLIMYILLIIASLIFNEFIVINICGLANNTKLFLDYKEKNDLNLISEINNEISPDDLISEVNIEENNRISLVDKPKNSIELTEL